MDEYVPNAYGQACFHGESWYRCPHCRFTFEYFDAVYEKKGIKETGDQTYVCPECKKKFKVS